MDPGPADILAVADCMLGLDLVATDAAVVQCLGHLHHTDNTCKHSGRVAVLAGCCKLSFEMDQCYQELGLQCLELGLLQTCHTAAAESSSPSLSNPAQKNMA